MNKVFFSGHESFHCRQFWLKKGYDFVQRQGKFSDKSAVVELGVGKNMVAAIHYWLKSFALLDENHRVYAISDYLFGANGKDPYLENIGTLWLLHYLLVTTERASLYSLVFNEFRKERIEFTKAQLNHFLERKCQEWSIAVSTNSLQKDVDVFIKSYLRPTGKTEDTEDDFSALLIDLDLLQELDQRKVNDGKFYKIESQERDNIPAEIALYAILEQETGDSISFNRLLNDKNSVGIVFAMNANGLLQKINAMTAKFPGITFTDDAGIRELQFIQRPDPWAILDQYYAV